MDWTAQIDQYCERLAPGLWGEPLNALSNAGFLLAAWLLWRQAAHDAADRRDGALRALAVLVALVGIDSLVFHTVATRWAEALDVGAIGLFMAAYPALWLRRVRRLPWRLAWLGAPAFFAFAAGVAALTGALGWTLPPAYLAAGVALLGLTLAAGDAVPSTRRWLLGATLLFALSLSLRQLDLPWCGRWPLGTHWAWHLLNAGVLWAASMGLRRR